ncbi:MAG: GNAT family N-acetyltransferase [Deltaproteobacteria bacterium]|nr:GNAT family N-acetyltransferase [Deltaproteobacteria bacterium]
MKAERIIETKQGAFVVRPYRPEDESGVLSLWKAAFEKEMPPALWRWKYLENPYKVQVAVCISEKGVIRVVYGGIPYRANWKGKTVSVTHLADIMSHPDCRGTGLFVRTGAAFFDLFAGPQATVFYYGFPGEYHFNIGKRYLEYTALEPKVSFLTGRTKDVAQNMVRFGGRVDTIMHMDDLLDDVWKRCCADYPFALIRDSAFLRWRFSEHPLRRYEIWGYRPYIQRGWKAYAVFALEGEKARMVDILGPRSERTMRDFLARLGARFVKRGIKTIETWLPGNHFLADAAGSVGFSPSQEPLGIIPTGRSFHPSLSLKWASTNIYYSMADGDLF